MLDVCFRSEVTEILKDLWGPEAREILMFVSIKVVNKDVMLQSLIVLILVLVNASHKTDISVRN